MSNPQAEKSAASAFLGNLDTTVLAGLVFLGLGGGIITLYYAHIRYLPDIEWSSSIVHLATATLIGGGLAILFALSLFLPGCIWSAFLLRDEKLRDSFFFSYTEEEEICLRTLSWNIGFPFAVVVSANHVALVVIEDRWQNCLLPLYGATSAILLILIAVWINSNLGKMLAASPPLLDHREKNRRLFKYITWYLISILLSQLSMLLIYLFSGRPTGKAFGITTAFCTLGILISNHFVAIHIQRNRVQATLVALVITALLLFIADRNSVLSVQVLAFFGLGEKSASVDLLLTADGKKAIADLRLPPRCAPEPEDRLCDVQVLSRLGDEYLLKAADKGGNQANDKIFTLEKSAVISRISRPPDPSSK